MNILRPLFVSIMTLSILSGCNAEPALETEPDPTPVTKESARWDQPTCPDSTSTPVTFTFVGTGEPPALDAGMTVHHVGGPVYCVDAFAWSGPDHQIVTYSVNAAGNAANYGESYTTSDRAGSEELLNFPFRFNVYGRCREVTATVAVVVGGTKFRYTASGEAGRGC